MGENRKIVTALFGLLLAMFLGGILLHQLNGYPYPATKANNFEFNKLNDLYEAFVLLPVGLAGLWLLRRGSGYGPIVVAGTAVFTIYNYAMMVTGRQNLWIFLWVAKLALSGPILVLCWPLLPVRTDFHPKTKLWMGAYLALIGIAFSKLMGQRLLASATGRMVDMSMVAKANADWGDPALRDPIVFFVLVLPVLVLAILGLADHSKVGARLTTLMSTFVIGMVSAILFTGPLKEALMSGSVSAPMWGMSAFMTVFTIPAAFWVAWSTKSRRDVR